MSKQETSQPNKGPLSFLEGVKDAVQAVAPGLSLDKMIADVSPVIDRMMTQGAAEAGALIFQGQSYVPYGDGQETIKTEQPAPGLQKEAPEIEIEM